MAEQGYDQLFTMHGTIMLLLFGTPVAVGLGNYIVPLQIGADDMAFPRLNALSFWVFLAGALIVMSSFLVGGRPGRDRLDRLRPAQRATYEPGVGVDLWIVGLDPDRDLDASSARSTSSSRSTAAGRPG